MARAWAARAWVSGVLLGAGLLAAAPARAHEHRMDKCGCHHQYGLRHCHPNKSTQGCEAPVRGKAKVPPPVRPGTKL